MKAKVSPHQIATSALLVSLFSVTAFASDQNYDLVHAEYHQKVCQTISVPQTLTYDQVQLLKKQELVIGTTHLNAEDQTFLQKKMPGGWRIATNYLSKDLPAKLITWMIPSIEEPWNFNATYSFTKWFDFSVAGCDEAIKSIPLVLSVDKDVEEITRNEQSVDTLTTLGYHSLATRIKLHPVQLEMLRRHSMMNLMAEITEIPVAGEGSGLGKACLNAGKYIFSFAVKPLIKKHVPYASMIYPEVEGALKVLGYPTITHFIADVAENKGKLSSPLLIKDAEKNEEQGKEIQSASKRNEGLHAVSRGLGYAVSFIPYASSVRDLATMAVTRKGYPTLTHWAMGAKEMTIEEIQELRTNQTKIAEELVATGFAAVVPYGNVLVAISHTTANVLFNETSMTAFAIHQIEKLYDSRNKKRV